MSVADALRDLDGPMGEDGRDGLIARVDAQVARPDVQEAGLLHKGRMTASAKVAGSLSMKVIRDGEVIEEREA